VRSDLRDAYRDMCFLTGPGLRAAPMPMIETGETRVGLEVVAVGYPAGELAIGKGRVVGLHSCECDGGKVIQTSAACDLGARQKWRPLASLGREWTQQEPNNPEAWMALGRARKGLGQSEAAAAAFQRVLMLDSTHAEATWALRQMEFELGRNLVEPGGL
jgi:hypothetical protein